MRKVVLFALGVVFTVSLLYAVYQAAWFAVGYLAMNITMQHGTSFDVSKVFAEVIVFGGLSSASLLGMVLGRRWL